jgi:hypothetical protein
VKWRCFANHGNSRQFVKVRIPLSSPLASAIVSRQSDFALASVRVAGDLRLTNKLSALNSSPRRLLHWSAL